MWFKFHGRSLLGAGVFAPQCFDGAAYHMNSDDKGLYI
jgi:hypothetical protein